MRFTLSLGLLFSFTSFFLSAQQPQKPTASELYHDLQQLNFLGSAMYIAAHPDDENTRLISYLANDVKARTAYLSLTRGDGGQNLVGPEIRELLGVIRTQELLAARRIDGGEQLFTRANDFGYSKHPVETLEIWNQDEVLGDVVRAIRKFKPDVIVNRFDHRSPGSTHGHHTASAMLSVEAFDIVNDASKYTPSAETFGVWKPKRLFFNTSWWFYGSREKFDEADKTNLLEVETGNYYPSLGLSNGEIAALSRSMHKSQGFGSTGSRGSQTEYLEFLKGDFPANKQSLFEGFNTSWSRIDGGKAIGAILSKVENNFNFENPASMVPQLMEAYKLLKRSNDNHWRSIKLPELERLILNCAGVYIEAVSDQNTINRGGEINLTLEAINRSGNDISLNGITTKSGTVLIKEKKILSKNEPIQLEAKMVSESTIYSTPYWLNEKGSLGMYTAPQNLIGLPETPAPEQVIFNLSIQGFPISIEREIIYKYTDPVAGEVYKPLAILPEMTSRIPDKVLIFASEEAKQVPVIVKAGRDAVNGMVQLNHPEGWSVSPATHTFELKKAGEELTLLFTVTPSKSQSEGFLKPLVQVGDSYYTKELIQLDYDHLPFKSILLPAEAKVARITIEKRGQSIGYISGAGDAIPESLRQIGYTVSIIEPSEINAEVLEPYDAVVIGIRAYNTVPELAFKQEELNSYVENGGTLVAQYNTSRGLVTNNLSPYPLELSRDRVTDEFSEVSILAPDHPILNNPNTITESDFENWVQERGLYFPNKWAPEFTPILGMNDTDEEMTKGSLLVASYGKGYYVYTGLSFFRELPAGVPGAYRLFANILSIGNGTE